MADTRATRVPAGLKASGKAFWRRTVAVYGLSDSEFLLLREVCRTLDRIDELERILEEDGSTVPTSKGDGVKLHPLLPELRQQRAALGRLLAQLALPGEDGTVIESPKTRSARKAAETRWRPHNRERGRA